ncbi:hypothetical protein HaLaN_31843, partial [Haematococcus lacustris]
MRLHGAQEKVLERYFKLEEESAIESQALASGVYLDPKWAWQRLRLYGAQDWALEQFFKQLVEDMAEVSMERHGHAKQLVVFFGADSIGHMG